MADTADIVVEQGLPVPLPSGAVFYVATPEELDYLVERVRRYNDDNHFTNIAHTQDVDRLLMFETFCFRIGLYLSRGQDYYGEPVDERALRRSLAEFSSEVRQLKKILGIDKVTLDRTRGDESVPRYLQNLGIRARSFGVMREEQCGKTIELGMELTALLQLHDNCDETERREMHVTEGDLLDWVRTVFIPELMAVDAYYREHEQRYWIRNQ